MKLAYIILAHKQPEQLVRLIKVLNRFDPVFMIHIDRSADSNIYKTLSDNFRHHDNVYFLKRHVSKWGRMGCVKAMLEGVNFINEKGIKFDYLVNLSGQDYPIKTVEQIHRTFEKNNGLSYLKWNKIPYTSHPHIDQWIRYYYIYFGNHHIAWLKENMFSNDLLRKLWNPIAQKIDYHRIIPGDCKPYHGSAYWCLHSDCVRFIYGFIKRNSSFVDFFNHVHFPDEFFIQTLVLNSEFKAAIINDNLRYIDFSEKKAHPKTLSVDDFQKFSRTGNLFARKFDVTIDSTVLDKIDSEILSRY